MANRMRSPPTHQQQQMQQMHGGMPGQGCLESQYSQFNGGNGNQQSQGLHPRQQSMPAAVFQGNTPPHNNMSPPPPQMQVKYSVMFASKMLLPRQYKRVIMTIFLTDL